MCMKTGAAQFVVFLREAKRKSVSSTAAKHELGDELEVWRVVSKPLTLSPGRRLMRGKR